MEEKNQSQYWDKKTAAEQLHISQSTLEKWMQQGLPYYKLGRKVLFRPEEVDAGAHALFRERLLELTKADKLDGWKGALLGDLLGHTRDIDSDTGLPPGLEPAPPPPKWAKWMWGGLQASLSDDDLKNETKDEVLAATRHTYHGTLQLVAYCLLEPDVARKLLSQDVDLIAELAGEHAEKLRPLETIFVPDRTHQAKQLTENEEVKQAWEFLRPRLTINARRAIDRYIFERAFKIMKKSDGEDGGEGLNP